MTQAGPGCTSFHNLQLAVHLVSPVGGGRDPPYDVITTGVVSRSTVGVPERSARKAVRSLAKHPQTGGCRAPSVRIRTYIGSPESYCFHSGDLMRCSRPRELGPKHTNPVRYHLWSPLQAVCTAANNWTAAHTCLVASHSFREARRRFQPLRRRHLVIGKERHSVSKPGTLRPAYVRVVPI
jgi:hypothetical protein